MIESGPHDAVTGVAARSVRARIERGAGNAFIYIFPFPFPILLLDLICWTCAMLSKMSIECCHSSATYLN